MTTETLPIPAPVLPSAPREVVVRCTDIKDGETRPGVLIGWNTDSKKKLPAGALGRADIALWIKHGDRVCLAGATGGRPIIGLHDCPIFAGPVAQPVGEHYWASLVDRTQEA